MLTAEPPTQWVCCKTYELSFLTRSQLIQILLLWGHMLRTTAIPCLLSTQKLCISLLCLTLGWDRMTGLGQGHVYTTSKSGLRIPRTALCSPSPFPGPLWRLLMQGQPEMEGTQICKSVRGRKRAAFVTGKLSRERGMSLCHMKSLR